VNYPRVPETCHGKAFGPPGGAGLGWSSDPAILTGLPGVWGDWDAGRQRGRAVGVQRLSLPGPFALDRCTLARRTEQLRCLWRCRGTTCGKEVSGHRKASFS